MSVFNDSYGSSQRIVDVSDSELTPKPLRIAKRGVLSESEPVNTLTTFSTSSTQQTLVPVRSSSIGSMCSGPDFPQPSSKHSVFNTSKIPNSLGRQRLSKSIITAANDGLRSLAPSGVQSGLDDAAVPKLAEGKNSAEVKATGRRAFTEGALVHVAANRHKDLPPAPGNQVLKHGRRQLLHEHPIFGRCSIIRAVSKLANRSHTVPTLAMNRATNEDESAEKVMITSAQTPGQAGVPGRVSESSERIIASICSDLDDALAAFPTPPTSNETSPSPFEASSGAPQAASAHYRSLRKPEDTCMMGAKLTMTAEYDQMNSKFWNTMLVAIDIEGAAEPPASIQDLWSQHVGLDVVVIIDNSLYTSPTMLMTSCEITRTLASTLNVVTDRLAILCTSPINDHRTIGSDFTRIWPLSSIKERRLKLVLDNIVPTKQKPTESSWMNTMEVAKETLLQSAVPDPDTDVFQDTFGHVIILTNNAEGIAAGMLTHDVIKFHCVCPVSAPLRGFDSIECNGWKLRSKGDEEINAVRARAHIDPASLTSKLRQLIVHARTGKDAGELSYLSVGIKPGPGCKLEYVLGKIDNIILRPGELRTVLVRLRVAASLTQTDPVTHPVTLPSLGKDFNNALKEIRMLQNALRSATILTASLKYKHSLLPLGTTCVVTAECKIPKRVLDARQKSHSGEGFGSLPTDSALLIHNRLAYYLATHRSPKRAFSAFTREFGEEGWNSYCPDYTHSIFKELKYQARIVERLELAASPKKQYTAPIGDPELGLSPKLDRDHFVHQSIQDAENNRPASWATEDPEEELSNWSSSQRGLLGDITNIPKPRVQVNRKLYELAGAWDDVETASKGSKAHIKGRATSFKGERTRTGSLERLGIIRHQRSGSQPTMLRNKVSFKGLALKNVAATDESVGKGLGEV